jgi:TRAP-type C4-dicarboxylate transport system permease small subunit
MMALALLDRVERLLIGLFGTAALAVGTFQVIGRYVDQRIAFAYGEEVVVYCTVWAVFLAASQLVRTDGHVRPDLVLRLLPPRGQRWVEVFNCCVALAFCGGLTWFAFEVAAGSFDLDERSSTGLEFPMWIYYASIPVGAGLMTLRYVLRLYRYLFRFDPDTMVIAAAEH